MTVEEPRSRRTRRPVQHFQPTYSSLTGTSALVLIGDGTELECIPEVRKNIQKEAATSGALKLLHTAIFGDSGEEKSRKKRLLGFRGLSGASAAATDSLRHRADTILRKPENRKFIQRVVEILALVDYEADTKNITNVYNFLKQPSLAMIDQGDEEDGDDEKESDDEDGKEKPEFVENAGLAQENAPSKEPDNLQAEEEIEEMEVDGEIEDENNDDSGPGDADENAGMGDLQEMDADLGLPASMAVEKPVPESEVERDDEPGVEETNDLCPAGDGDQNRDADMSDPPDEEGCEPEPPEDEGDKDDEPEEDAEEQAEPSAVEASGLPSLSAEAPHASSPQAPRLGPQNLKPPDEGGEVNPGNTMQTGTVSHDGASASKSRARSSRRMSTREATNAGRMRAEAAVSGGVSKKSTRKPQSQRGKNMVNAAMNPTPKAGRSSLSKPPGTDQTKTRAMNGTQKGSPAADKEMQRMLQLANKSLKHIEKMHQDMNTAVSNLKELVQSINKISAKANK